MPESPNVAIVIDALSTYGGAEHVLAAVLELYPRAPIYTLIYRPAAFPSNVIAGHEVHSSWIQNLPGGKTHYRKLLPLLPLTFEQFDLRGYDLVLSLSYAVAHGVLCRPDQLHISYTFTPLRYAWQNAHDYFQHGLMSLPAKLILHYLRLWDQNAAARVDHFAAISKWTAASIRRAYHREAEVIYPPVEVDRFRPLGPRGEFFVAFSRLVRHKRLELIVEAFSRLGLPLVIIGEGPEKRQLAGRAAANIKFAGWQSDEQVAEWLGQARALVHAAEEDFGLVMVEAQAAGCPVIALGRGAAREIIQDGRTGILFPEPGIESLMAAVRRFVHLESSLKEAEMVENAARFNKQRFQNQFAQMVEREWNLFTGSLAVRLDEFNQMIHGDIPEPTSPLVRSNLPRQARLRESGR